MIVQLISSASLEYYPENEAGNFRVQLPKTLEFPENSEVALLRLRYPKTWKNIDSEDCEIVTGLGTMRVRLRLTPANYRTAQELVDELNRVVRQCSLEIPPGLTEAQQYDYESYFTLWIQMRFSISESGHLQGKCFEGTRIDVPGAKLRAILGMRVDGLTIGDLDGDIQLGITPHMVTIEGDNIFKHPINLHAGDSAIFVYSDLCRPGVVSDSLQPLLGIATTRAEDKISFGELITYESKHLDYLPLATNRIENIRILLTDINSSPITFESGTVIVTLDIREK